MPAPRSWPPLSLPPPGPTEGRAARKVSACWGGGGEAPPCPSLGVTTLRAAGPEAAVPPLRHRADLPQSPQLGTQTPQTHHVRTSRDQPRNRGGRQRGRRREPRTREPPAAPPRFGASLTKAPARGPAPPPLPAPSRARHSRERRLRCPPWVTRRGARSRDRDGGGPQLQRLTPPRRSPARVTPAAARDGACAQGGQSRCPQRTT